VGVRVRLGRFALVAHTLARASTDDANAAVPNKVRARNHHARAGRTVVVAVVVVVAAAAACEMVAGRWRWRRWW
jgi:hypothetical protein